MGRIGSEVELPGGIPDSIAGAFEWSARAFGADHVIVVDERGPVPFGELQRGVEQTAATLHRLGVGPGDRVAVSLPNDRRILELLLATQRVGAVWVGINENLTDDEKSYLLADCAPTVIVGAAPGSAHASAAEWHEETRRPADPAPRTVIDPRAPAAISYTSGTTGRPKGVIHSQHNLMVPPASFAWSGRFVPGQRIGVAFPLTILNLVIQGFLAALAVGGTCCVLTRRDAGGLLDQIAEHRVEFVSIVPTTAYDIVHRFADQARAQHSLRHVAVGGGHVRPELLRDLTDVLGVDVEHGYGLTEAPGLATNGIAAMPLDAGRALAHVHVDVRDEDGQPLVDEPGEIVLSTKRDGPFAGVWAPPLGYWGMATVPRGHPHEVWTADHGRMDASGTLTVLDRRSDIILRGGSNVYPAEIERVVAEHDGVQAAVVVGRTHERFGQVPVAIVELDESVPVSDGDLVAFCRERIAAYKVPEVVIVPEIRRNAMGKADRVWARTIAESDVTAARAVRTARED